MSTRSSARNIFLPLDNPKITIRRRSRSDHTLLNNFEMAAEGNGDPPVPGLQTMEESCQPSLNGQGGPIDPIAIQATNIGLKNDMIQQVQNSYQFHGLLGGTFIKRCPKECYDLIENMTAHHNDWDTSAQWSESSSSITSFSDTEIAAMKSKMAEINKSLMRVLQVNQQVKAVTPNCETCGGHHSFNDCPATVGQTQNVYAAGAYQVERETEVTKDTVPPTNIESTKDVQPSVVQTETSILNSELVVAPIIESVVAPVSAPKPNQNLSIPYPSILHDQKLRDKANDQREKFFQIFKYLNFNISFTDALTLMPKFDPRVPLILGISFPKTERALIDVFEGDLTLRVGKEAITFKLDQTSRYSANYNDMTANRIDVIDMACEEYLQEVLGFSDVIATKTDKSLINEPPEVELKDLPPHLEYTFLDGDDKLPVVIAKDLSVAVKTALITVLKSQKRAIAWKLSDIKEKMLKRCEDTNLCLNWEKSYFMVKEGIVLGHKISKNGIEVDKSKVDVIAKLPHRTTVKGIRIFLGHAGFYLRFIQYFLKIARPMTRLLEKDTLFFFSKEYVEAF
nr:reverse transcriptase domain-containing protein [Tanacetum cinerariifolium]